MPPLQSTSNCCRAVRQQIRPTPDGIWITDAIVAATFRRYCAVSPAARRYASFVPGPLESRRRLGKRYMTDLYSFQSHAVVPPWALEIPEDLEKWTWRPPSLWKDSVIQVEELVEDQKPASIWTQLSDRVLRSATVSGKAGNDASDGRNDDARSLSRHADQLVVDLNALDYPTFCSQFTQFTQKLAVAISRGHVQTEQLCELVKLIAMALKQKYGDSPSSRHPVSLLCKTILDAIATSPCTGPNDFQLSLWRLLLKQISSLRGQERAMELLQQTIHSVPTSYLDYIGDLIIRVFKSHQCLWGRQYGAVKPDSMVVGASCDDMCQPEPARKLSSLQFQSAAAAASVALGKFSREATQNIFKKSTQVQLERRQDGSRRDFRIWWLSIFARMPEMRDSDLGWAIWWLLGDGSKIELLFEAEVCHLLALQWKSRGFPRNSDAFQVVFEEHVELCADAATVLAGFMGAICRVVEAKAQMPTLRSVCQMLESQGRLDSLVDSFRAKCGQALRLGKMDARTMALVAIACNDYRLAARLHGVLVENQMKFDGGWSAINDAWDWQVCMKYMDKIVIDQEMSPLEIRRLLGVDAMWKGRWLPRVFNPSDTRNKDPVWRRAKVVESTAEEIVRFLTNLDMDQRTPRLERVLLSLVETRIRWLNRQGIKPGPRILQALTRLLIQDLVKGEAGRKSRFRWLLGLIASHVGPEEAMIAGQAIGQWRQHNSRVRREQEMGEAEE